MEYQYFYSKTTGGFYNVAEKNAYEASLNGWPVDAVAITEDEYNDLFNGQATGKVIIADDDGKPYLAMQPEPTNEQLVAAAEQQRQSLIADAIQSISVIQIKLQAGRKLTVAETAKMNLVLDYIDDVQSVNVSIASNIEWPNKPNE
ncbi:TPA: tail fiber assembly protein [Serratia fonticola]